MQIFIVRTDATGSTEVPVEENVAGLGIARGDRVLFYQVRGEPGAERGVFVAWGEIDRLSAEGDGGIAHLRALQQLKRRVPFSDLRADPRRSRDAAVQPASAEVFNLVLSHSRR